MDLLDISDKFSTIKGYLKMIGGEGPLVITEPKQKESCIENMLALKELRKEVENNINPMIKPVYDHLQELYEEKNVWLAPIDKAINLIDNAVRSYNNLERERINAIRAVESPNPEQLPDTRVVQKTGYYTASESPCIDEIMINDHATVIQWAIESGLSGILKLDKTTETALKKYLIDNPGIKAVPGLYFKRGFKNNLRGKR